MTRIVKKQALVYPILACLTAGIAMQTHAADLSISVQNLTQGIHFTPFIIAGHDDQTHLFEVGKAASTSLQMMAEGGNISGLASDVMASGGEVLSNPNMGLLAPAGMIEAFDFDSGANGYLSITSMLLPTNDAFAGVDAWKIPTEAGSYVLFLNAYDAGTEANNELLTANSGAPGVLGIPADPGGMTGSGGSGVAMSDTNTSVHIHRGSLGDDDNAGGKSDLDNTVHRWLNPVLKVTIVVK